MRYATSILEFLYNLIVLASVRNNHLLKTRCEGCNLWTVRLTTDVTVKFITIRYRRVPLWVKSVFSYPRLKTLGTIAECVGDVIWWRFKRLCLSEAVGAITVRSSIRPTPEFP